MSSNVNSAGKGRIALLWAAILVLTFAIVSVADRFERTNRGVWDLAYPILAILQLFGVYRTGRWLGQRKPHRNWHVAKLALLWVLLALMWMALRDSDNFPAVMTLGGGALVGCAFALTWTWLSAREREDATTPHH